jgi:hypothetical protein
MTASSKNWMGKSEDLTDFKGEKWKILQTDVNWCNSIIKQTMSIFHKIIFKHIP